MNNHTKDLKFDKEARESLLRGVQKVKESVVATLGPKGSNIAIDKGWGTPKIVHDGVSIAREIVLENKFENMGAQLVIDAAEKTNDTAGDGTTTATLLTERIFSEGLKQIDNGTNPMLMKSGIEKAVKIVVKEIENNAKKIKDDKEIEQIATVSAQNEELGKTIAEAIKQVGKDGLITVDEGNSINTTVEYTDGFQFDKGYLSTFFITDAKRRVVEIEDCYIFITDAALSSQAQLLPFMEAFVAGQKKNLLIIADNIDSQALGLLIYNNAHGKIKSVAVRAPEFGEARQEYLEDIALLTGGKVASVERGDKLESITTIEDWIGLADKVIVGNDYTKIIGGHGDPELIKKRIENLRESVKSSNAAYNREKMQIRLSKLTGGAAIVNVGGVTEVEMKDSKERVIDAIAATQAAIDEGVIPGGGVALINSYLAVLNLTKSLQNEEEIAGARIILNILSEPLKHIVANSGEDPGWVLKEIMKLPKGEGYNVMTGKFVNMISDGIIDPAKVLRLAVQNASSIAAMMLTTKGLITDKPAPEPVK